MQGDRSSYIRLESHDFEARYSQSVDDAIRKTVSPSTISPALIAASSDSN